MTTSARGSNGAPEATPGAGPALPGAEHTLFRGYGPFIALVALILAMALLAPTIAPERTVTTVRRTAGWMGTGVHFGRTGVANERRNGAGGVSAAGDGGAR